MKMWPIAVSWDYIMILLYRAIPTQTNLPTFIIFFNCHFLELQKEHTESFLKITKSKKRKLLRARNVFEKKRIDRKQDCIGRLSPTKSL